MVPTPQPLSDRRAPIIPLLLEENNMESLIPPPSPEVLSFWQPELFIFKKLC